MAPIRDRADVTPVRADDARSSTTRNDEKLRSPDIPRADPDVAAEIRQRTYHEAPNSTGCHHPRINESSTNAFSPATVWVIRRITMPHPALASGAVAVVTGGAAGIGLTAAERFAGLGLRVCIADLGADRLADASRRIAASTRGGEADVLAIETDVSRIDDLRRLEAAARERFGGIDVVMNNAGIQPGSSIFGAADAWRRVLDVNLWGVIQGSQVFVPGMIERGRPGLVINTGSKQGITTPPGDPAYNVAKAGVKVFTEALQHELRNRPGCRISAHLLIPGFVFTGLTAQGRTEKPPGAWTPEQTIDFMMARLEAGDFYILCPDNDVPRALDERRILWAAGDIAENRPPLSRWHPDFKDAFDAFARQGH
jgi:NAD(P)-dependent dehydrogenase (short-subunit alcohol dehydrogenase family)